MGPASFDLAVAGSGIMGLACALEESLRGKRVAVIAPRPAETGGSASWAAAGILVTRDARVLHSPFREFYVRSIHLYPAWLETLSRLSGRPVPLHRHGDYLVFDMERPGSGEQLDAKRRQWEREHARNFTETGSLPAFLSPASPLREVRVFHFPDEAYVQNRDLLLSLREACRARGVVFLEGSPMGPWDHQAGRTLIKVGAGPGAETLEARQVLVAAGVWTGTLLASLGVSAPLIPVKGQMMRIPRFHREDAMVHYGEELYLVPRGDSLVVGATTEAGTWEDGFDRTGAEYLDQHLRRFLPEIARGPVETWAGLRPRTKDRLPWMGWLDASRGWALCAGHYKCGISMAPLAAESMSALLGGGKPPVDLEPFDPWRRKGLKRIGAAPSP